jgi:hypothetical protein
MPAKKSSKRNAKGKTLKKGKGLEKKRALLTFQLQDTQITGISLSGHGTGTGGNS